MTPRAGRKVWDEGRKERNEGGEAWEEGQGTRGEESGKGLEREGRKDKGVKVVTRMCILDLSTCY